VNPSAQAWTPYYAGDRCLILEFGQTIERSLVDHVVAMNARISAARIENKLVGIEECVPTFRSLAVIYNPLVVHPNHLIEQLKELDSTAGDITVADKKNLVLPVCYGKEFGPDISDVAALTGLDEDGVIELHQSTEFSVYMLGFLPGFAFLGDTPATLHLPRRSEPRTRVPAGSVAIAMQLTGIYPWDSPGGWHILGRCPVPLFDGHQKTPTLFTAGDTVRFRVIDLDEYETIIEQRKCGTFDRSTLQCDKR